MPPSTCFPVLFPRHTNAAARDNTINLIHTFRDYLHYHIKCSKVPGRGEVSLAHLLPGAGCCSVPGSLQSWGSPRLASLSLTRVPLGLHPHTHEGKDIRLPQGAEPSPARRREEGDENYHVSVSPLPVPGRHCPRCPLPSSQAAGCLSRQ